MAFVHLHNHSEYSLLDGACRLEELVKTAKEMGMSAVAVTDHGCMYSAVDFYKLAKKNGIKPIIGCEVYVAPNSRFDKNGELDRANYHMVLLCENNTGYKNLAQILSQAWTEGFYNKPRIDDSLLEKHHEGLICLSACLAGEIPRLISRGNLNAAKEKALYYNSLFGQGNFYLEMQNHGIDEERHVALKIQKLAEETGIPLVVTNDCHYINKDDSYLHQILLCIQTNHTINDPDKMEFTTDEFYFKSEEEMRSLFKAYPEAYDNTVKIAQRCNVEFEFGKTKLPHFEIPNNQDHFEYFKNLCIAGLHRNYGENLSDELKKRLDYELSIIKEMGYTDYFLIVADFINYAKSQDIPVGPGRGSGAGSLAAYCIGITGIDPIKYNLIFERFLNPERVSMPDFDVDFCKDRRQEVIDYVIRKYGSDHVAQIIAFGTMAARGAIRDVGRALAMPYGAVDAVAKLVPNELGMTIKKALTMSKELEERYRNEEQVKVLIDTAMSLEGMPRNATTHAAGVVITRDPVSSYVPLAKNNEAVVTQYTMTTLEELGLLKMDFLGLRNLTVLKDAENMILKVNPSYSEQDITENDKAVFEMLSKGQSDGVFQFESPGMKSVLAQLKPSSVEDLIAVISLYRPGPMDSIPRYIENRHNPNKIKYKHPLLKSILDVTYGCIVYQEQVMQIFRTLAGYSLGRADIVRRAMSKKKKDVMEREQEIFLNGLVGENGEIEVEGCLRRGVDRETAVSILKEMESFASYAFNKSHAAAYANVAYKTAWMKCHYPKEYMAALLTSVLDNPNKLAVYTSECARLGIKVLPPDVNISNVGFTVSGNDIRFGLLAIKNLGKNVIDAVITERQTGGRFTGYYNFCKRLNGRGLNSRALESLVKSGSLDGLDLNRREMLINSSVVLDSLDWERKHNAIGQLSFFDDEVSEKSINLVRMDDFGQNDKLAMEKETTGMYLSGHPLSEYAPFLKMMRVDQIGRILDQPEQGSRGYNDGQRVRLLAIITAVKIKSTKNNDMMAFVTVEDMTGSAELIVFPQPMREGGGAIFEGAIVDVQGSVNVREDEEPKILCNVIKLAPDIAHIEEIAKNAARQGNAQNQTAHTQNNTCQAGVECLCLRVPSLESEEYFEAKLLIDVFDGRTPLVLYLSEEKRYVKAPMNMWVDLNPVLVSELKRRIGESNVVVKTMRM
ncbi:MULTISPECIES: DNA polymerase III subunit alpha [unclassified Ruminococcus]|uniref:DNA polymerase III subunit alpha n=1 Tax=unclassified Ruminococcus TaxID=2608920 RepID=UPI00210CE612|nr:MULTISPECIES: DNA polymerase III subunit alpha [unclassified Ruminococcus]MCQ4022248.1 DNA polymerase III subunit alpha [Ruminococcus sp. zg-924]MCQ4114576.1 DNA polymerase III subunit alpha [Ruminococcus sp. zg-921]